MTFWSARARLVHSPRRTPRRGLGVVFGMIASGFSCAGCGGGVPLHHSAHPLPPGHISFGSGAAAQIPLGDVNSRIDRGEAEDPDGTPESIARRAFLAPGISPWFGARLGLGDDSEGGLTYTGRSIRVDARRALVFDDLAVSAGLGLSSVQARRSEAEERSNAGVLGWGADVPLLIGWRSRGSIVSLLGGVRPGYERLGNFASLGDPDPGVPEAPATLSDAYRWYVGGLVGLAVGVHPFWIYVELAAAHHWVSATERTESTASVAGSETSVSLQAFTLSPSGALVLRF